MTSWTRLRYLKEEKLGRFTASNSGHLEQKLNPLKVEKLTSSTEAILDDGITGVTR
jgi:hypothetical protein